MGVTILCESSSLVSNVAAFAVAKCELKRHDASFGARRVSLRQEDERWIATLGLGANTFRFEGERFTLRRTREGAPVCSNSCDAPAQMYERAEVEGPSTERVLALLMRRRRGPGRRREAASIYL